MTTVADFLLPIEDYRYDPARLFQHAQDVLLSIQNGAVDLVDASNPFVYSLENAAFHAAAFMSELDTNTRRQFPVAAQTREDLYLHMSDKDYIGAFATPATAKMTVLIPYTVLTNAMVLDSATGNYLLTIPRNTVFSVASTQFSLQYPVTIKLLSHGGLQMVYETNILSPLQTLSSNLVDFIQFTDVNTIEWVQFDLEVTQFFINTYYQDVSASAGYVTDVPLNDQFYYARVWKQVNGAWVEIRTTHAPKVLDPATPTAIMSVLANKVRVTIPPVYINTGLISGKIRIDVYNTKGRITMPLKNYQISEYSARWYNVDTTQDTVYTAAMTTVTDILFFSTSMVDGGTNMLSFGELKQRVIKNALGDQIVPITNAQLQASVDTLGFTIGKGVDTVTNRIFSAVRGMPSPTQSDVLTAANASITTLTSSLQAAAGAYGAYDNGEQVTLSSKTLYVTDNGVTRCLTQSEVQALKALSISQLCKTVSAKGYAYSPFTYVLDTASQTFSLRPYYLDSPKATLRNFVAENETTGLQVALSSNCTVKKTDAGFEIYLQTQSSADYQGADDATVFAQLAFQSVNKVNKAYINGEIYSKSGKERIFKFLLASNFKINADHRIAFTNLVNENNGLDVVADLTQSFDVVFSTTIPMPIGYVPSTIELGDVPAAGGLIPTPISHQRVTIEFGTSLGSLWSQARSVVSSAPFEVYPSDVYATYTSDVYDIDPVTGTYFSVNAQGQLVYNIRHRQGDPILTAEGAPIVAFQKGQVKLDAQGNPIPSTTGGRYMIRVMDLFMMNACYYFATSSVIKSYLETLNNTVINWITQTVPTFQDSLLDETMIYYRPLSSKGSVSVLNSNNQTGTITSEQSLQVKFYVSAKVYNDADLTAQIRTSSIKLIDQYLNKTVLSTSELQTTLTNNFGQDVISVEVAGFGGANNYPTLTVLDEQSKLSIKKKLVALADGTLTVEEDIAITFTAHGV
jgi:hypothetical protein